MWNNNAMSVQATGLTLTTVANTSQNGTVPLCSDGATRPKYLRFASTLTCYVRLRPQVGTAVAVNTDLMVQPGAPVILEVHGNTHYALIDDGTITKVNITPLENA